MKYLALLLFLLLPLELEAQGFALYGIDTTSFPTIKARCSAYDSTGKILDITPADVILSEDGLVRPVTKLSCPSASAQVAVSAVLTIDVSGSMRFGYPNIELAKTAATSFVNAIHLGFSECAVTSFDHLNYLNQDFTTDRKQLLSAISSLEPRGGTDHDMGLRNPPASALSIAKNGKNKRIVIYLTDGEGYGDGDAIVKLAKATNVVIFTVALGIPAPDLLRKISGQTGGRYYENVRSPAEAESIYLSILQEIEQFEPCLIEWESVPGCLPSVAVRASVPAEKITATAKYSRPSSAMIRLQISPSVLEFGASAPNIPTQLKTKLTAYSRNISVSDIIPNDTRFKVIAGGAPFSLQSGESHDITVEFTPSDSGYAFASFRVETDVCSPFFFYATGGFLDKGAEVRTLHLLKPNGGESYSMGSDTVITWEGVPPSDSVKIELSTNAGATWNLLKANAGGLQDKWQIPNTPSNKCLVRVSQLRRILPPATILSGHTDWLLGADLSPNGTDAVTASEDHTAIIWDVLTGKQKFKLTAHKAIVGAAVYSPDGTQILTVSRDQSGILWDAATATPIRSLLGSPIELATCTFSKDGTLAITGDYKGVIRIWNVSTGAQLRVLSSSDDSTKISSLDIDPSGSRILSTTQSGNVTMWNINTGRRLYVFSVSAVEYAYTVRFIKGGTQFVTGGPTSAILWDANSGSQIKSFRSGNTNVTCAAVSPDGGLLATGGSYQGDTLFVSIILWNLSSGDSLLTLRGHRSQINTVQFGKNGRRLISSSIDYTARIWDLGNILVIQQDTSDAVFSIESPKPTISSIDLGRIPVGISRDSIVKNVVRNANTLPIKIDSITFSGVNASEFRVVSGGNFILAGGEAADIEFSCKPLGVGIRTASVLFHSQGIINSTTITANGFFPSLSVAAELIDFGKVRVGSVKDSTIALFLKNTSGTAIKVKSLTKGKPDSVQFDIVQGGGTFILANGETREVTLRFAPTLRGRTSGSIIISHTGIDSVTEVRLFGEGVITEISFPLVVDIPTLTCRSDTTIQFSIKNISEAPVTLQNAVIFGTNASEFTWLGTAPNGAIPIGGIVNASVRLLSKGAGLKSAFIVLTTSGVSVKSDTIALRARQDSIGFFIEGEQNGKLTITMFVFKQYITSDTLVRVFNTGVIPLEWNLPLVVGNFSLVEAIPPQTPVGGSSLLRVRFNGRSIGNYYAPDIPLYETKCNNFKLLTVQANVRLVPKVVLTVGSATAKAGEYVDIPLIISNLKELQEAQVTGIIGTIRTNGTLLATVAPTVTGIYSGDTVRVKFSAPIGNDSILTVLHFRVGLGNDTTTTLIAESAVSEFGIAIISTIPGLFTLQGICTEGTTPRLYRPAPSAAVQVAPNPIEQSGEITITTGEKGRMKISLSSVLGTTVSTVADDEFSEGTYHIPFVREGLSSGVYFLLVELPTQTFSRRVIVR
ncbi:MAG: choice-of-anchor D domain-containing protein [Bacteroidetes bacterium]|nr:choice-of-anchor D domain-containing protein [Bacteroidota bacterium]